MTEIIVSFFLIAGATFALIGSIGLLRLPDFFSRLHGPTKSTTLGVGGMLIASAIHFSTGPRLSLHEILVTVFLFMTAPVSAHLVSKAALHLGVKGAGKREGQGADEKA
jgi:multicomponent K+:H+ antiporter subunit G